jgi:hypothetical protein
MKPNKKEYAGYRLPGDAGRIGSALAAMRAARNAAGANTNAVFATTSGEFKAACEAAEIPATTRQASKYQRKTGRAWAEHLRLKNAQAAA